MTDSVVLLEPGDDRAKKIGKAMASQTANDILSLLKKGDLTLTEISDSMSQPLTTIKYQVENLLDAGLVEVKKVKYSEKGREVKVYGVCEQIVIVSAGNKDIRQILMKYASVFGFFIIATLALGIISSSLFSGFGDYGFSGSSQYPDNFISAEYNQDEILYTEFTNDGAGSLQIAECSTILTKTISPNNIPPEEESNITGMTASDVQRQTPYSYQAENAPGETIHIIVLSFFIGGCAILLILMGYEAFIWRKEKKYWKNIKNNDNN
ncbi:MAG: winged helix-turn-helix domain-containing protein [Methanomicrobium sp.]|nr:winged helix-turn-helix domain-containing protein [Methanomicrobium sp.]